MFTFAMLANDESRDAKTDKLGSEYRERERKRDREYRASERT